MNSVHAFRFLPLLIGLSVPVRAADPGAAPTAPGTPSSATQTESTPGEELPLGAVQRGTLANPKLLRDTAVGVRAAAGALGITRIEKALPYVMQMPQGPHGSRAWKERWIVSQGDASAAIDIRFVEDGAGAANWSIEVPENAPAQSEPVPAHRGSAPQGDVATEQQHSVAAAKEFVRQAQSGNVDRMIEVTSPQTIRNSGRQQVEESYRKYVVPRFKAATVRWAATHAPATDAAGNRGWDVIGEAEGPETFAFFITVMKENGRYVVATLGRHNPDDQTP